MERPSKPIEQHKHWVISKLQEQIDPKIIGERFGNNNPSVIPTGNRSSEFICVGKNHLSKDRIQQEMYAKGYRRVKKEEKEYLTGRYQINYECLNEEIENNSMFFTPVFPKKGENSLVVIAKDVAEEGSEIIQVKTFANWIDNCKRMTDHNSFVQANTANQQVSQPQISQIDFDQLKAKSNLVRAREIEATRELRNALGLPKAA